MSCSTASWFRCLCLVVLYLRPCGLDIPRKEKGGEKGKERKGKERKGKERNASLQSNPYIFLIIEDRTIREIGIEIGIGIKIQG
jgi:hypothetical protein